MEDVTSVVAHGVAGLLLLMMLAVVIMITANGVARLLTWLGMAEKYQGSQAIHLTASKTIEQLPTYPTDHHDEASEEASVVLAATESEATSLAPTADKTSTEDKQLTEVTDKQFNVPQEEPTQLEPKEETPKDASPKQPQEVACVLYTFNRKTGEVTKSFTTWGIPVVENSCTENTKQANQTPQPASQVSQEPPTPVSTLPSENNNVPSSKVVRQTLAEMANSVEENYRWLRQAGFSPEEAEQYMNNRLADTKEHREEMENDNKAAISELVNLIDRRLVEEQQHKGTVGSVAEVLADLSKRLAALEDLAIDQLEILKDQQRNLRTRVALLEGNAQEKEQASLSNGKVLSDRIAEINKAMAMQQGTNNARMGALESRVSLVTELANKLHKKTEDFGGAVNSLLPGGVRYQEQNTVNCDHQTALLNLRTRIDQVAEELTRQATQLAQTAKVKQTNRSQPLISQGPEYHPEVNELWKGRSDLEVTLDYLNKNVKAARSVLELRLQFVRQNIPVSQQLFAACSEAEQLLADHFCRVRHSYIDKTDEKPLQGAHCVVDSRKPS